MESVKPTILYLLDTLQTGGAEKSLLEIASRFREFRPVFVTLFNGNHDLLPEYEVAGIKVIRLGLPVSNRFAEIAKKVEPPHRSVPASPVGRSPQTEILTQNWHTNKMYGNNSAKPPFRIGHVQ